MALQPRPFDPPQRPYTGRYADTLPDPTTAGEFNFACAFPQFYYNSTIQHLGKTPRWTISTNFKAPINIQHYKAQGAISGAVLSEMDRHLTTLDDVMRTVPNAANCCYFLDVISDGYIMLDIEPECPEPLRSHLLTTLQFALYAETSMSGKGFHVLLPKPENFDDYPLAAGKNKVQDSENGYEILLSHWVTFTRNPIDDNLINLALRADDGLSPEALWEKIAPSAQRSAEKKFTVELDDDNMELTIEEERLKDKIVGMYHFQNNVTPAKFHNDMSKFEFSRISKMSYIAFDHMVDANAAKTVTPSVKFTVEEYRRAKQRGYQGEVNTDLLVKLTYNAVKEVFEPRAKHAETRNGMPYLLYRVISNIEGTNWTDMLTQRARKALEGIPESTPRDGATPTVHTPETQFDSTLGKTNTPGIPTPPQI